MESRDKNPVGELFIADDPVKTAKELQFFIDLAPYDQKEQMADLAIELLGSPRQAYGGEDLMLDINSEILLTDADSACERYEGSATAMITGGGERFVFWKKQAAGNLCLKLVYPHFIEPDETELGLNVYDPTTLNLYVSVYAVETVLAA